MTSVLLMSGDVGEKKICTQFGSDEGVEGGKGGENVVHSLCECEFGWMTTLSP